MKNAYFDGIIRVKAICMKICNGIVSWDFWWRTFNFRMQETFKNKIKVLLVSSLRKQCVCIYIYIYIYIYTHKLKRRVLKNLEQRKNCLNVIILRRKVKIISIKWTFPFFFLNHNSKYQIVQIKIQYKRKIKYLQREIRL